MMSQILPRRRARSVPPCQNNDNDISSRGKNNIRNVIRSNRSAFYLPLPAFFSTNEVLLGTGTSSVVDKSSKQIVVLVLFRIIAVAIVFLCCVWGYVLFQISLGLTTPPTNAGKNWDVGWTQQRTSRNRPPQKLSQRAPNLDVSVMDSPILIFTCRRAEYLNRTLWNVFRHHPTQQFLTENGNNIEDNKMIVWNKGRRVVGAPVIISEDGTNPAILDVIEAYREKFESELGVPLYRMVHTPPDPYSLETPKEKERRQKKPMPQWEISYRLLAAHYGWALEQTFSTAAYENNNEGRKFQRLNSSQLLKPPSPQRVIILEEDIEIGRDFFSLMNATADLLDSDSSLLAVSAFNDNGKGSLVSDPLRLLRSDFFPGLGWMMSRQVWYGPPSHQGAGFRGKWPNGFWDDWVREPASRRGRHVLRPEISRTYHFGSKRGASQGQYNKKLNEIRLNDVDVRWEEQDLSYLDATVFAENYWRRVSHAELVHTSREAVQKVASGDVRLAYSGLREFQVLADTFKVMIDEKAGVPRTAYEGIVEVRYGAGKFLIFLTPKYVNGGSKPADFGMKAWLDLSKESLLQRLMISL